MQSTLSILFPSHLTLFMLIAFVYTAFDSVGALDRLDAFMSVFGANFYGLPTTASLTPHRRLRLVQESWTVPESYSFGDSDAEVVPLRAGQEILWKIA